MIKNGYITKNHGDDKAYKGATTTAYGKQQTVQVINPWGMSSTAPIGSMALLFSCEGKQDVIYAMPYTVDRPKGQGAGDCYIFSLNNSAIIKILNSGNIEIICKDLTINATNNVNINCKNLNIVASNDIGINCKNFNITAQNMNHTGNQFKTTATSVELGSGGEPIARKGDSVSGGIITGGSSNNKSA